MSVNAMSDGLAIGQQSGDRGEVLSVGLHRVRGRLASARSIKKSANQFGVAAEVSSADSGAQAAASAPWGASAALGQMDEANAGDLRRWAG